MQQKIKSFFASVRSTLSFLHTKENCEFCTRYEEAVYQAKKEILLIGIKDQALEKLDNWMKLTERESYVKMMGRVWAVFGWIINEQSKDRVILSVNREALEKIYAATSEDEVIELANYIKNTQATLSSEATSGILGEETIEQ